ncbi:MAG: AMIN domain-containing protein, partial [bacterium]|nr:AMIN domain-containing protein [bacterium]
MSRKKVNFKRLIILLLVAGALGIFNLVFAVSEVNNVNLIPGSDGALVNIAVSGPKDYTVNKVGNLIIIDLKDSENNYGERTITGDGNVISEVVVTQYMRQPQKQVRVTIKLARDIPYNITKTNGDLSVEVGNIAGLKDGGTPSSDVPEISDEEIMIIATEKYITQLTEEADRLMEAKKYKEATALYNKIASGDYKVPQSVINEVKKELGLSVPTPTPTPKPTPKPVPIPEPEPE